MTSFWVSRWLTHVLMAAVWTLSFSAAHAVGAASAGSASARTDQAVKIATGAPWHKLSATQQRILAPLKDDWPSIEAARKSKWIEIAARFQSMPVEQQQRIQERMAEWARLSPAERATARIQFQDSRQIRSDDRQASWSAYLALPEDQKRALALQGKPEAPDNRLGAVSTNVASGHGARPAASAASNTRSKTNLVAASSVPSFPKTVSPTVVQATPGATTTLISQAPRPPLHQRPGLPKIAATDGFVDPSTLLPKRAPQGAEAKAAGVAATTDQK